MSNQIVNKQQHHAGWIGWTFIALMVGFLSVVFVFFGIPFLLGLLGIAT